jgi:hypothetical protein
MDSKHPEMAISGIDVVEGFLGGPVRAGDAQRLNRHQHLRLVQELTWSYSRWCPPAQAPGTYRAVLPLPAKLDDPLFNGFDSVAIFAHQIVLRDPLDMWLHDIPPNAFDLYSIDLDALEAAIAQTARLRPLIDAGVLVLVPTPPTLYSGHPIESFLRARDGIEFAPSSTPLHELIDTWMEYALDTGFASSVLGREVDEREWSLYDPKQMGIKQCWFAWVGVEPGLFSNQ